MAFQLIPASLADIGLATASAQATQIGQLSSSPAATIAQDVSNTGTPLLQGLAFFGAPNSTLTVPAAGSASFSVNFTKPGYLVDLYASIAAAAAAPWCLVEFKWQDSGGATIAALQHWYLPASSTGPWRVCGQGPTRGPMLTVTVTNYDPAKAITLTYSLAQTTQHIARDDWRAVDTTTANVAGYGTFGSTPNGLAFSDLAGGVLINQSGDTIPASTQWGFLLPLYCGVVYWQVSANSNIAVSIRTPASLVTPVLDGNVPIWLDLTTTDVTVQVTHPRMPLVAFFQNTTASPIAGVNFMALMLENCS